MMRAFKQVGLQATLEGGRILKPVLYSYGASAPHDTNSFYDNA